MPVLYEVNVDVLATLGDQYDAWWTNKHVGDMRAALHGITHVEKLDRGEVACPEAVTDPTLRANAWRGFTFRYTVESRAQLDDYLEHRSATLRGDAAAHFGDNFRAYRRIVDL